MKMNPIRNAAFFVLLFAILTASAFAQQRGRGPQGNPGPPPGMQPLAIDMFTSKNFYQDKANWMDKRYYRCNIPRDLEQFWASGRTGANPPTTATWGDCNADLKRDDILSPYPYKTAKEHYNALLAATKAKGCPTVPPRAAFPGLDGYFQRDQNPDPG